ncbi:NADPH-dependent 2,4-dienoyl-CoA reductase/sulfur reductase-like enzyme [Paraburkholderia tropica]|uniref:FAD/NAD(P)-dependent oxidoreductase n=1 Tax=Paraburkholderia tropica TaxID=92647 RepID=UPI00161424E4|nr:FAD/NAD(P)-binding oxidoreductase [Paraburkholderia tropica]MBB3001607.1 NADPH-dependent 2,4-dienoyl-CoA reductase/sulfur reductase-like enzyme [Paraburkholderia tropica]MBB6321197.1 NADPH-dependent 2,4-dienoyl-CoA reductase/sulfur reductase-like enzyme [Paraburkholderia tropica]
MGEPRIVIVGAGPAGVRCAQTLLAAGLRPTLIDEGRRDGGQIYRRQPDGFTRPYAKLYGTEALRAQDLHETFTRLRAQIDYRPQTLAWNIWDKKLHIVRDGHASALDYDALILCPGATDRLIPVKGWQFAGTYSLGAAQIALKSQACSIGRRVVFMGTGPLLYLVASQYVQAGAKVAAVLDTSAAGARLRALPKLLARFDVLRKGSALVGALKRAGVQMYNGIEPVEIVGTPDEGVSAVRFRTASGKIEQIDCDAIGMGYHLRPETQLADLARCAFRFDTLTRQWLPQIDELGRSSVSGVYLAGDGVRVLGADGAENAGRLAAHAALIDLGRGAQAAVLDALKREQRRMDRFREGLAQAFEWPAQQAAKLPDETMVCRCEGITAGELRRVIHDEGAQEANRAKALSRVGMGRCQGRYCGHAAAEIIADAARVPLEQVGRLRGQAPVKPLAIATVEETE